MTKKDFIKQMSEIDHPIIKSSGYVSPGGSLVSSTLFIVDATNRKVKFEIHTLKITKKESLCGDRHKFYKRVKMAKIKYERWMHNIFGNYCTSELKIK